MKGIKNDRLRQGGNEGRWFFAVLMIIAALFLSAPIVTAEKWGGVDELVVERIAADHGREASGPLIDTDQGDLLLFMFLIAGAVAGFAGGYYWRVLTTAGIMPTRKENG